MMLRMFMVYIHILNIYIGHRSGPHPTTSLPTKDYLTPTALTLTYPHLTYYCNTLYTLSLILTPLRTPYMLRGGALTQAASYANI